MVGDFDSRDDAAATRAFLRQLAQGRQRPCRRVPPRARVTGRPVLLVDKPGATQTYFWLGNVGASRTDPARTAQSVVNTVFGGRFTSMLNTELRIKSGLTYGASASVRSRLAARRVQHRVVHRDGQDDAGDRPGARNAGAPAQGRPRRRAAEVVAELHARPVPADDRDQRADRGAAGRHAVPWSRPGGRRTSTPRGWRSVDAAAVRSTIEQSFPQPDNLALVLIGDAAKIRDAVQKYGPVTEMKITDPRFAPGDEVKQRTALIAGASGLVGGECLRACLQSAGLRESHGRHASFTRACREVTRSCVRSSSISRSSTASSAELRADHVFCALGTTIRKAGSQAKFRQVDFEYPRHLAELDASQRGEALFAGERARRQLEVGVVLFARQGRAGRRVARDGLAEPVPVAAVRHRWRPSGIATARTLERSAAQVRAGHLSAGRGREIAAAMVATALREPRGVTIIESREISRVAG